MMRTAPLFVVLALCMTALPGCLDSGNTGQAGDAPDERCRVLFSTEWDSGNRDLTEYVYDENCREISVVSDGGSSFLNTTYNILGNILMKQTAVYTFEWQFTVTFYNYDLYENLVSTMTTGDGIQGERWTNYSYDLLGRQSSVEKNGGTEFTNTTYDWRGNIATEEIAAWRSFSDEWSHYTRNYTYNESGLLTHTMYNGVDDPPSSASYSYYTHDEKGRVISLDAPQLGRIWNTTYNDDGDIATYEVRALIQGDLIISTKTYTYGYLDSADSP